MTKQAMRELVEYFRANDPVRIAAEEASTSGMARRAMERMSPRGILEDAIQRQADDARDRIAAGFTRFMDRRRALRLSDVEELEELAARVEAAIDEVLGPEELPLPQRIVAEAERLEAAGRPRPSWAEIIANKLGCTSRYVRNVLR